MTYVFGWLGLVTISLWVSLVAFLWAVKSGQFDDQQRLRYLPLRDQSAAPPPVRPNRRPIETLVLFGISVCVVSVFLVALLLSLVK